MEFNKYKYKVYTWKNGMVLHWVLNPGLAINELILGQRIPKISLEDLESDRPRIERIIVPCPHCNAFHDGRTWSTENGTAFKNWFGLYCKNCGDIIPCLTNITSLIILTITFPIWGWFKKSLKEKWLHKQPKRFTNISIKDLPNSFDTKKWFITGLIWGLFMFFIMTFFYPFLDGNQITLKKTLIGILIWSLAGIVFGFVMNKYTNKTISKNNKE